MDISNIDNVYVEEYVKIPTLISAFSCGLGTPFEDGYDFEEVPKCFVKHDKCFLLQVTGDSMEPTLVHGDLCFIDINIKPITNNIVAVVHNGDFMLKRFIQRGFSTFLVSDNNRYQEIKLQDCDSVMILGVVYNYTRKV